MRWVEIEQSAARYRETLGIKKKEIPVETEPIPQIDPQQVQSQKQAEVEEILDRFKVSECMEAIGREVWEEGHIERSSGMYNNIFCKDSIILNNVLVLGSDPITEIQVSTSGKEHQPMLIATSYEVSLDVDAEPSSIWDDRQHLEVRSWSIYNFDKPTPTLRDALKRYGLTRALKESLALEHRRIKRGFCFEKKIQIESPYAEGEFYQALEDFVSMMRENNSLPKQVREWCQERVSQLPKDWPIGEWIKFDQLRDFAYQVRGTPNISKTFDRFTDYRFA